MSKKTVPFTLPVRPPVTSPDDWVASRATAAPESPSEAQAPAPVSAPATPAEPMKRFTIDVSAVLHRRIKAQCATRGTKMADVIRDLLEREFPARPD